MNYIERSKNIAVDFDDVLVPTFKGVLWYYNNMFKWKSLPYDKVTHFWLNRIRGFRRISTQECVDLFNNLLAEPDFHQSLKAIKDSFEVCAYLKDQWHNLYIITARPKILQKNTIDWLSQNNVWELFSDAVFLDHKWHGSDLTKSSVCKDLGITVMIEDAFHNADPLAQNWITVLMPRRPWNKKHKTWGNITVVWQKNEDNTWQEIKGIYQATC